MIVDSSKVRERGTREEDWIPSDEGSLPVSQIVAPRSELMRI